MFATLVSFTIFKALTAGMRLLISYKDCVALLMRSVHEMFLSQRSNSTLIESASHNSVRTIEFANGCLVHSIRKLNKKNCDGMSHQWMAAQMQMQYSMPRWNVQLWANVM